MKRAKASILLAFCLLFAFIFASCQPKNQKIAATFFVDGELYEVVEIEKDAAINFPKAPEKDGYIFDGWVCRKSGFEIIFDAAWSESGGENRNKTIKNENFIADILGLAAERKVIYDGIDRAGEYAEFKAELEKIGEIEGIDSAELEIKSGGEVVSAMRNAGIYVLTAAVRADGISGYVFSDGTTEIAAEWTYEILKKEAVVVGIYAENRLYNGTRAVAVNSENKVVYGIISGDDVTISINPIGNTSDAKVGNGKLVTLDVTEEGGDIGNYEIVYAAITVNINKAESAAPDDYVIDDEEIEEIIIEAGLEESYEKVYDGVNEAIGLKATIDGIISDLEKINGIESVVVTYKKGGAETESIRNVGEYMIEIVLTAAANGETEAWAFMDGRSTKTITIGYTITKAMLTISGIAAIDREYDGTNVVELDLSEIVYWGLIAGDEGIIAIGATGTIADASVGKDKAVMLTVEGAENYEIVYDVTVNIKAAEPTDEYIIEDGEIEEIIIGAGLELSYEKVYDGVDEAIGLKATLDGIISDLEKINGIESVVATYKKGEAEVFAIRNAGDYTIEIVLTAAANGDTEAWAFMDGRSTKTITIGYTITKAMLTISGITAKDREYDGTNVVELDLSEIVYWGLIAGDEGIIAIGATGTIEDASVGKDKAVTLTVEGAENYEVSYDVRVTISATDTTGEDPTDEYINDEEIEEIIIEAGLELSYEKVYDGVDEIGGLKATIDEIISDLEKINGIESVVAIYKKGGVETESIRNVGGYMIEIVLTTKADEYTSYTFEDGSSTKTITIGYTINKAPLTISGISAVNREYDGTNEVDLIGTNEIVYVGLIADDEVTVTVADKGTIADASVGMDKIVVLYVTIEGADAMNYEYTFDDVYVDILASGFEKIDASDETRIVEILNGITDGGRVYDRVDRFIEYKNSFAAAISEIEGFDGIDSAELTVKDGGGEVVSAMKNADLYRVELTVKTIDGLTFGDGSTEKYKEITYEIEKKIVTVGGIIALDDVYDAGKLSVELDYLGGLLIDGVIGGDELIISNLVGTMKDDSVGIDKPVTISADITGADAANYEVVFIPVTVTIEQ